MIGTISRFVHSSFFRFQFGCTGNGVMKIPALVGLDLSVVDWCPNH